MCVIMIVSKRDLRPTTEMLDKAWHRNPDGCGMAWREKGEVHWKKGLNLEEVKEMVEALPVPYILHFRRASLNGGGICPELTHPFTIDAEASLDLEGHTKGDVLFHNGNMKEWMYEVKHAALQSGVKIPTKRWSDTRGLAFLMSIYGYGYMDFLVEQRGVAFNSKGEFDVFTGPGWVRINNIWCSNDQFWVAQPNNFVRLCKNPRCAKVENIDSDGFCPAHAITRLAPGTQEVSPVQPVPFCRGILRTTGPKNYKGPLLSLEEAESMEKTGKITKNLLKAIRKAHFDLGTGGKEAARAERALGIVSHQILGNGQRD